MLLHLKLVVPVLFLYLLGICKCHDENRQALDELENLVEELQVGNDNIRDMIRELHDSLMENIEEAQEPVSEKELEKEQKQRESRMSKVRKFMSRIENLEKNIETIENYIVDEKATDKFLRDLEGDIGVEFLSDMAKVKELAAGMKLSLKTSLAEPRLNLQEVEDFANSRNVVIGGIMYYDGIGSPCGSRYDVCRVERSECRDEKCQCRPGLSYDHLQQTCVEKCEAGYGSTYQTVNNHIIRGFNNIAVNDTSLDKCKELCETQVQFVCKSFDYFPDYKTCFLSEHVKGEAEDGWEYNGAGSHFQRDCEINQLH